MKYLDNNGLSYLWQKIKELISGASGIPTNAIFSFKGTVNDIPEGFELVEEEDNPYREIYEAMFPIGRGFIDFTDTDYSNWLGFTWERELVGMFPVGYNPNDTSFDTIGEKGGEKTHTLTESELPSIAGQVAGVVTYGSYAWGNFTATKENNAIIGSGSAGIHYSTLRFGFGSGQAHNNLPPYQVVSYWKRVAPKAKISFSIYGITYQAEEGMTFGEWLNSSYNTDGWTYYSESITTVYNPAGNLSAKFDIVSSAHIEDIIEDGKTYTYYTEK